MTVILKWFTMSFLNLFTFSFNATNLKYLIKFWKKNKMMFYTYKPYEFIQSKLNSNGRTRMRLRARKLTLKSTIAVTAKYYFN